MVRARDLRKPRGLLPLLLVSAVVVGVVLGFARGIWVGNLHNGLLALSFTLVGAYVLFQRPGHREGLLFMAAGAVEAVMFLGRQVGHSPTGDASQWWGWLGVWPLPIALLVCTFAVICFPDGRLPSRRWRSVAVVIVAVALSLAAISAVWPVDYESAGVLTPHPLNAQSPPAVERLWSLIAHPAYVGFQLLWVVAVVARWRTAGGRARRQLTWLVMAAVVSVAALAMGLLVAGTPTPGLIAATLLPIASGLAIVHGQQSATYSALTWLSRTGREPDDLPGDIASAVGDSLGASRAILWMGQADHLQAVGVWPETGEEIDAVSLAELAGTRNCEVRPVVNHDSVVGALSIDRPASNPLSLAEERLFGDLAAQAALVLDHLDLAEFIARERRAGHLEGLTSRERDVLELMARGMSNAAICDELHLSIKTIEPVVSTIFAKLELHPDAGSNRRVLAVLAFVRTVSSDSATGQ